MFVPFSCGIGTIRRLNFIVNFNPNPVDNFIPDPIDNRLTCVSVPLPQRKGKHVSKEEYLIWEIQKALAELKASGALQSAQRELWMDGWLVTPAQEIQSVQ